VTSARITAALVLLAGCGGASAVERGRELAADPKFSPSSFNDFACTTCHDLDTASDFMRPGYTLAGAANRPSFWGGQLLDLKSAVDFCVVYFMKGDPLDPSAEDPHALYEYLDSIKGAGPAEAQPLTIDLDTRAAPAKGDATRGQTVHEKACAVCHGAAHTGEGSIAGAPILPDAAAAAARAGFPDFEPAAVFTEKVRHGQFFGVGGNMPPFSFEALSDEDLGALFAFYAL
jgi:thiosulfate dehydrogenase